MGDDGVAELQAKCRFIGALFKLSAHYKEIEDEEVVGQRYA